MSLVFTLSTPNFWLLIFLVPQSWQMADPYKAPTEQKPELSSGQSPLWTRCLLSLLGFLLYCSTPWRDAGFYRDILNNEGFGTTADTVPVGIAGSSLATIVFSPVALFLIGYGIGAANRITVYPRLKGLLHFWAILATILLVLMLLIESDYLVSALRYRHHWDTAIWSLACVGFMYVWWCCSLTHRSADTAQ